MPGQNENAGADDAADADPDQTECGQYPLRRMHFRVALVQCCLLQQLRSGFPRQMFANGRFLPETVPAITASASLLGP